MWAAAAVLVAVVPCVFVQLRLFKVQLLLLHLLFVFGPTHSRLRVTKRVNYAAITILEHRNETN